MRNGTYCKDGGLTFTQGISLDFYYPKRFSEYRTVNDLQFCIIYEFNGFKSLERTTIKNAAFTDAERNDPKINHCTSVKSIFSDRSGTISWTGLTTCSSSGPFLFVSDRS